MIKSVGGGGAEGGGMRYVFCAEAKRTPNIISRIHGDGKTYFSREISNLCNYADKTVLSALSGLYIERIVFQHGTLISNYTTLYQLVMLCSIV